MPRQRMRPKRRVHAATVDEYDFFFLLDADLSEAEKAAIAEANEAAWTAARIESGRPGTRDPGFWDRHDPGGRPRLLRVVLSAWGGCFEVRESEAARLHRLGLLWPAELALWDAGQLEREVMTFDRSILHEPGVVVVDGATWEAMSERERLAMRRRARPAR
ncbi:MAG TPA: hypothetical protein P5234_10100 [Thermoanaerobaculaceae bacterium]|nr:hypothetical protein [Thermoanaerobaculaceae bacterium]HRS16579.1 hypothetical protein [Thermoanaerobaculaceae bacterium]